MSERRITYHKEFDDSSAKYDEYWTMQYKVKFLWHTYWKNLCHYTESGPILMKWWDKEKVQRVAKHYGIEMPL